MLVEALIFFFGIEAGSRPVEKMEVAPQDEEEDVEKLKEIWHELTEEVVLFGRANRRR